MSKFLSDTPRANIIYVVTCCGEQAMRLVSWHTTEKEATIMQAALAKQCNEFNDWARKEYAKNLSEDKHVGIDDILLTARGKKRIATLLDKQILNSKVNYYFVMPVCDCPDGLEVIEEDENDNS